MLCELCIADLLVLLASLRKDIEGLPTVLDINLGHSRLFSRLFLLWGNLFGSGSQLCGF